MSTQGRTSKKKVRQQNTLMALGLVIVLLLAGRIYVGYELSPVSPGDTSGVHIDIPKGAGAGEVARILVEKGLARNREFVELAIALSGDGTRLKAGSYSLTRAMPLREMIGEIVFGRTDTIAVVVPEGFTTQQIADRLASKNLADPTDFTTAASTTGQGLTFPDGFSPPSDLEGYLFPLTYKIEPGASAESIAQRMVAQFDKQVVAAHPDVRDWRRPIIVASLVEREAKIDSDRPLIASVYYNRLRKGMPLQCDATVQYALPAHKARLMYSDLRIDSPYNTYLHKGLPPGPICNPGLSSIAAALNPAKTDYLYYVAGPSGAHIFSRTLAEQEHAIREIRSRVGN